MMSVILAVLILGMISKSFVKGEFHAWCNMEDFGCGETPNSMCIYDEALFKHQCLNMVDGIVMESWIREYWLALINSVRDKVAQGKFDPWPAASDMKQLIWDDTLESQARRWNFQCYLDHPDACNRNFFYSKTQIAQFQAYARGVSKQKFSERIKGLLESVVRKQSAIQDLNQLVDKGISQNSQQDAVPSVMLASLLFANLEKVGASLIVSGWENTNESNIMRSNTYLAPMALNTSLYKRGKSCSGCPENWSCHTGGSYPHLCALSSHPHHAEYVVVNYARRRFEDSFTLPAVVSMIITVPSVKLF